MVIYVVGWTEYRMVTILHFTQMQKISWLVDRVLPSPKRTCHVAFNQACSHRGASGCKTPTANLDAPAMNSQNMQERYAEEPAKKRAALYQVNVLFCWTDMVENNSLKNTCLWEMFSATCNIIQCIM